MRHPPLDRQIQAIRGNPAGDTSDAASSGNSELPAVALYEIVVMPPDTLTVNTRGIREYPVNDTGLKRLTVIMGRWSFSGNGCLLIDLRNELFEARETRCQRAYPGILGFSKQKNASIRLCIKGNAKIDAAEPETIATSSVPVMESEWGGFMRSTVHSCRKSGPCTKFTPPVSRVSHVVV
jgi:hypothetical protein